MPTTEGSAGVSLDQPLARRAKLRGLYFEHHLRLEGSNHDTAREKAGWSARILRKLKQLGLQASRKNEEL